MAASNGQGRAAGSERAYDRIARFYDLFDAPMDWFGGASRRRRVVGPASGDVLEVGVGTGRNLEYYGGDAAVTGIDVSEEMLRS